MRSITHADKGGGQAKGQARRASALDAGPNELAPSGDFRLAGGMLEPRVLLVDDQDDSIFFMRTLFRRAQLAARLEVAYTARAALDVLSASDVEPPILLFLDIKLPGEDGFEVLRWCRRQVLLSNLFVVMLTSSHHITDVQRAEAEGADSFLVKYPSTAVLRQVYEAATTAKTRWEFARELGQRRLPSQQQTPWQLIP